MTKLYQITAPLRLCEHFSHARAQRVVLKMKSTSQILQNTVLPNIKYKFTEHLSHKPRMHQVFNRREVNLITDDLKLFLSAGKGSIDKLDYFTTRSSDLERFGIIELEYRFAHIDIIPEVENAVIQQLETADSKEISIQLHLSPASFIISTDKLFFQQIFFRLFSVLLEIIEKKSVISVYVTDIDGKCSIEVVGQSTTAPSSSENHDDYFKKHRITNTFIQPPHDAVLPVYKNIIQDMGGELLYSLTKGKQANFRIKFAML